MPSGSTDQIATWFSDHGDGEFVCAAVGDAYAIGGSENETGRVLYTTKPTTLAHVLRRHDLAMRVPTIGRYGLPNEQDVTKLLSFARGRPFAFLGDADPVDLLIFAWLRSHLPIEYVGINYSLIEMLGVEIDETTAIPLCESELSSMPLLAVTCPDYRDLLGPQVAQLLDSGSKLEIEILASSRRGDGKALASLLVP
jgi:hypothetical protein